MIVFGKGHCHGNNSEMRWRGLGGLWGVIMGCPDLPELISPLPSSVGKTCGQADDFFFFLSCFMTQTMCDGCRSKCFWEQQSTHTHLWLVSVQSAIQHLSMCEITAVWHCLAANVITQRVRSDTANVQPDNELGCDVCCSWVLAHSRGRGNLEIRGYSVCVWSEDGENKCD